MSPASDVSDIKKHLFVQWLYNILPAHMKLTKNGTVYLLIATLSALFSYLLITFGFFPHLGLSLSFILFSLLVFIKLKAKTGLTKVLFVITLALSLFISVRSEGFLTFFNTISVFYFGSLMIISADLSHKLTLLKVIFAPFWVFIPSLFEKNNYSLEFKNSSKNISQKANTLAEKTAAILITTILLFLILPLLSSANPIFADLVGRIIKLFNIYGLLDYFSQVHPFELIVRALFFLTLVVIIPRLLTYMNNGLERVVNKYKADIKINLLLPKTVLALVLLIFLITQFQLYFSSEDTLIKMGYTHSKYAREVFAQLSVVSLIVLVTVYNDKRIKPNRILTHILLAQTGFLILMALKSDLDYTAKWGFTYVRLYGFAGILLLTGLIALYWTNFLANKENSIFIKKAVVWTGAVLLLINILNFDFLIYNYRMTNLPSGIDYWYLSRLSPDSLSYKKQFIELEKMIPSKIDPNSHDDRNSYAGYLLLRNIDRLKTKYLKPDIRGFNFYEYLQYRQIRDIDTTEYYPKWVPAISSPINN